MNAITFYKKHDKQTVEEVCRRAGTNLAYFKQIAYGHRKASHRLAMRLAEESGGEMSLHGLRPDIYPPNTGSPLAG